MTALVELAERGDQPEKWCISHPEGPLYDTASDSPFAPVIIFCEALGVDWEDAKEQGYFLDRVVMPKLANPHPDTSK